jgi:hypothetical protein
MSISSESPGRDRNPANDDHRAAADFLSHVISEHIVADAPPDLDQVMATVPQSPAWVRVSFAASAVTGLWTLVILVARALLH